MLDNSFSESEEEPPETNEKGRPIRRSVKNAPKYDEGSSSTDELQEDDDDEEEEEEEAEEEEEEASKPVSRHRKDKKLVVKLKMGTSAKTGGAMRTRRGASSEPLSAGQRKSSRLHPEVDEPIVALTDSGRHAEIVRPSTQSPEQSERTRRTRGGKGPSKGYVKEAENTIVEEEEPSSGHPRQEENTLAEEKDVAEHVDDERIPVQSKTDTQNATLGENDAADDVDVEMGEGDAQIEPKGGKGTETVADDDDEDEGPTQRRRARVWVF
jgi:hypothetical protein